MSSHSTTSAMQDIVIRGGNVMERSTVSRSSRFMSYVNKKLSSHSSSHSSSRPSTRPGTSDGGSADAGAASPTIGTRKEAMLRKVAKHIDQESVRFKSYMRGTKPWENEDSTHKADWSDKRVALAKFVTSSKFEASMGMLIVFNIILIIWEADHQAACYPEWYYDMENCPYSTKKVVWLGWVNIILLVIYTVECCLGIGAFRKEYFTNRWSCLDLFVVITGWITEIGLGSINMAYMKIFRIARLVRAVRLVLQVRELYMLLSGFFSSIKAIFFGMILLGGMILVCSIVLVELVHPANSMLDHGGCERCPRVFKSVSHASLTIFQQIVAGDSWGTPSVRVIEASPWSAFWLVSVLVIIAVGVMNLILAVIVESAAESREKDMEEKTRMKQRMLLSEKVKLLQICVELDTNHDGAVSLEELHGAWDKSKEFRNLMVALEIQKDDLSLVYNLMDADDDGQVGYQEFVDEIYRVCTCDQRLVASLCRVDVHSAKLSLDDFVANKFKEHRESIENRLEEITENVQFVTQALTELGIGN